MSKRPKTFIHAIRATVIYISTSSMSRVFQSAPDTVGSTMMGSVSNEMSHSVQGDKHVIVYATGTRYEGQVAEKKWHGAGKVILANGDTYEV